jgi:glycosyltransferase involved in cell wall biosynthesis
MNILVSANYCAPNAGSEPGRGWGWALAWAEAGHSVHLVTESSNRLSIERTGLLRKRGIGVTYVATPRWAGPFERIRYVIWQWRLPRILEKSIELDDLDLVHHVTLGQVTAGSRLWKLRIPMIFGPAGGGQLAPMRFWRYYGNALPFEVFRNCRVKLASLNPRARQSSRSYALSLVVNEETRKLLVRLGARRVSVGVEIGVPTEWLQNDVRADPAPNVLRILWVGRIEGHKGLNLAIEAMTRLRDRMDWHMTVLGDGRQRAGIEAKVASQGLSERFTFLGAVPFSEVHNHLNDADVFLFPALRDSFPHQILEAMAHGKPTVTLNHSGMRDLLPEGAVIRVNPTTPVQTVKELSVTVGSLLDDPQERIRIGGMAQEWARSITWQSRIDWVMRELADVEGSTMPADFSSTDS